jgi:hypothetical protein
MAVALGCLLSICAMPAPAMAQSFRRGEREDKAQLAIQLARAGKWAQAVTMFDAAIEEHPFVMELTRDRGYCHEKLGHNKLAAEDFRAYVAAMPGAPDVAAIKKRIANLEGGVSATSASPAGTNPWAEERGSTAAAAGTGGATSAGTASSASASPADEGSGATTTSADVDATPNPDVVSKPSPDEFGGRGVVLAAHVGYALPVGSISIGTWTGSVPIGVDVGYRFGRHFYLGVYGQYAFAFLTDQLCPAASGANCSSSNLRFGIDALYYAGLGKSARIWFGAGTGLEMAKLSASAAQNARGSVQAVDETLWAAELAHALVGADFRLAKGFGIGPYASISAASYFSASATLTTGGQTFDAGGAVNDSTIHGWLTFGARGVIDM